MRPEVGVVEESEKEPSLEVLLEQGLEGAKAQCVFEGFPKPFNERDGADLADGTQSMLYMESGKETFETRVGELGTVVGDEVTGRAELTRSGSKELLDLS